MISCLIYNEKTKERYEGAFENTTEARHWIINHLDLSLNWVIETGKNMDYKLIGFIGGK